MGGLVGFRGRLDRVSFVGRGRREVEWCLHEYEIVRVVGLRYGGAATKRLIAAVRARSLVSLSGG